MLPALVMPSCGSRSPDWLRFWPQAEGAADIATSLEAFLASQRQDVSEGRELPDAIDLNQSLRLWILRLRESFDGAIVVLDLHCHRSDLLEHRAKRLGQT